METNEVLSVPALKSPEPESIVLDYRKPVSYPLTNADQFRKHLDETARTYIERLRLSASLAFRCSFADRVPVGKGTGLDLGWEALQQNLRRLQGDAALYQPYCDEGRKKRAIEPVAPQLLWLRQEIETISADALSCPNHPSRMFPAHDLELVSKDSRYIVVPSPYSSSLDVPFPTAVHLEAKAALEALARIQNIFGSFEIWAPYPDVVAELRELADLSDAWKSSDASAERLIRNFTSKQLKLPSEFWLYVLEALVATENESRGWRYWRHTAKPFAWVSKMARKVCKPVAPYTRAVDVRANKSDALYAEKLDFKAHRVPDSELMYDLPPGRGWVSLNTPTGKCDWDGETPLEFGELVPCPRSLGQLERDLVQRDFERALACAPPKLRQFLEFDSQGRPLVEIAETLGVPAQYRSDVRRYFERNYEREFRALRHMLKPYQVAQCGPTVQEIHARTTAGPPDKTERYTQTPMHDRLGIQRSEIWRRHRAVTGQTATGHVGGAFRVYPVLNQKKSCGNGSNPEHIESRKGQ